MLHVIRTARTPVSRPGGRRVAFVPTTLLAALLGATSGLAAPGGTGNVPSTTTPTEPRRLRDDTTVDTTAPLRVLPSSVQVEGFVHTASGQPLGGVRVRLFSNGVSLETVLTDPDGRFLLSANPMAGENHTADLWIESPDVEKYLDVNVLLVAGRVAREQRLFSACTPEVDVSATGATIDVTMLSIDEKKDALVRSGCLKVEP